MITGGGYCKDARRERVVRVAHTWLGTPYHPGGRVKGAGVDCLTLLAEVYHEAAIVPRVDVPYYPHDWHLHRGKERYLEGLLKYAQEIAGGPRMGDIALWRFARCFSHGAIVVEWPLVIHACAGRACVMENAECATWLSTMGDGCTPRPVRFFSAVEGSAKRPNGRGRDRPS